MKSYIITLPLNMKVDIFNLPENFKEIVEKNFSEYTKGTAKDYRYCDKLGYIDILVREISKTQDSDEEVINIAEDYFDTEIREFGEIPGRNDYDTIEFMTECHERGRNSAKLYQNYGTDDHHIYDRIQKVVAEVIKIVMNYGE